ncbi:MAG: heavy-metal-associated domain-containing protein [Ruminococcaceae bacterium]|nr:heavy-metal-associated domain-containing protein [Oscillospiraceae bacterium]
MKTLKVEQMHCINCVNRISSAFKTEKIGFEISLENRIVRVDDGKVNLAIELLDDLGFDAVLE